MTQRKNNMLNLSEENSRKRKITIEILDKEDQLITDKESDEMKLRRESTKTIERARDVVIGLIQQELPNEIEEDLLLLEQHLILINKILDERNKLRIEKRMNKRRMIVNANKIEQKYNRIIAMYRTNMEADIKRHEEELKEERDRLCIQRLVDYQVKELKIEKEPRDLKKWLNKNIYSINNQK